MPDTTIVARTAITAEEISAAMSEANGIRNKGKSLGLLLLSTFSNRFITYHDFRRQNFSLFNMKNSSFKSCNFVDCNLSGAEFIGADLSDASFHDCIIDNADFTDCVMQNTMFRGRTIVKGSVFNRAKLMGARFDCVVRKCSFDDADLTDINVEDAALVSCTMSGATGLIPPHEYIKKNFECVDRGFYAYKTFGETHPSPLRWVVAPGSIIEENVDYAIGTTCGSGINVATREWVEAHQSGQVWKVLVRWEWAPSICVPLNTDGKIRVGKCEIVGIVDKRGRK